MGLKNTAFVKRFSNETRILQIKSDSAVLRSQIVVQNLANFPVHFKLLKYREYSDNILGYNSNKTKVNSLFP